MVGLGGLEPPTFALSEQRSNHLSYKPTYKISLQSPFAKVNKNFDYQNLFTIINNYNKKLFICLKKFLKQAILIYIFNILQ